MCCDLRRSPWIMHAEAAHRVWPQTDSFKRRLFCRRFFFFLFFNVAAQQKQVSTDSCVDTSSVGNQDPTRFGDAAVSLFHFIWKGNIWSRINESGFLSKKCVIVYPLIHFTDRTSTRLKQRMLQEVSGASLQIKLGSRDFRTSCMEPLLSLSLLLLLCSLLFLSSL